VSARYEGRWAIVCWRTRDDHPKGEPDSVQSHEWVTVHWRPDHGNYEIAYNATAERITRGTNSIRRWLIGHEAEPLDGQATVRRR